MFEQTFQYSALHSRVSNWLGRGALESVLGMHNTTLYQGHGKLSTEIALVENENFEALEVVENHSSQ